MILLETDMRTLLTSAQRVCRRWRNLIRHSRGLQATLFFTPVNYTLPPGKPGIRNPLLKQCIWPWFCARMARMIEAPPVEGGVKVPEIDPQTDEIFLRRKASWAMMLFQQPPRSTIGLLERDYGTYTEVKVQPCKDFLRIGDLVLPFKMHADTLTHPLLEEGLVWFGLPSLLSESYGEIPRSHISYATSICLRNCDIVFFVRECAYISGRVQHHTGRDYMIVNILRNWLLALRAELVPGQIASKMPVN